MLQILLFTSLIEYGFGCIDLFPVATGSSRQCSNLTDTCNITCSPDKIFYDGYSTKQYACNGDGLWNPLIPGQGCLGKIEATFWLRFEVDYKLSGIALYCLHAHEKAIADNKDLFKSKVSTYCNNQLISVGEISINSTMSTTSSVSITTIFHLQIGDSSTTYEDKRACQDILILNKDRSTMFVYGNSLQCNASTVSINRTSINVNSDVSTCPVNHALVTDPAGKDYCVLDQPVVGVKALEYAANVTDDIMLHCEVIFGNEVSLVYWQYNSNAISFPTGDKYNGSTVKQPSLHIRNITYEDAGTYVCFASNTLQTGKSPEIRVTVIPRKEDIPRLYMSKSNYTVVAGQNVTLECVISAYPAVYDVQWLRNVTGVIEKIDKSLVMLSENATTHSITLAEVGRTDAGYYTCTATNIAGTGASSPALLDVIGDIPEVQTMTGTTTSVLGENIELFCNYTSLPRVLNVNWQMNRSGVWLDITIDGMKYTGSTIQSTSLMITNTTFNDEGYYVCSVSNFIGIRISAPVFLDILGDPPTISVQSTSYSVIIGDNVTLNCDVTGSPSALIVAWYRNTSGELVLVSGVNDRFIGGNLRMPSLIVTWTDNDDEGWFVCSATNLAGTTYSENIMLNISGAEPKVRIPSTEYTVIFGDNITLECVILAHPAVTSVQWQTMTSDHVSIINMENNLHFSGGTVDSPSLTLSNVNFTNEGLYRCTAVNQVGTGYSNVTELKVIGDKPIIKLETTQYDVIITTNVTMVCNVTGVPNVQEVTWKIRHFNFSTNINTNDIRYQGGTLEDNSLTIINLSNGDNGIYVCTGRNLLDITESEDILLNVTGGPPVVSVITESYEVILGDDVTLECSVYSHPLPTNISWIHSTKETTKIIDRHKNQYTIGTYPTPSLTIHAVMFTDAGNYICIARNLVGERTNTTNLNVKGDPPNVTVDNVHYDVFEDDNVTLLCNVSGIPVVQSVIWNVNTYGSSRSDLIGGNSTLPSLTLLKTRLEDSGVYTCTATNLAGTTEGKPIYLNVSEKCIKYLPDVAHSEIQCTFDNGAGSCDVKCVPPYVYRDGSASKQYSCSGRFNWSPQLPASSCLETAPSTYLINLRITYKTSYFAFYCKEAHENSIYDNMNVLIGQMNFFCNNEYVSVGPLVINSTMTITSSFDIYTTYAVIIGNSSTSKENKEACASILGLKAGLSTFMVYGNSLQCNGTASTITKSTGSISEKQVLCPDRFTVIAGTHICVSQIPVVETNQTMVSAMEGDVAWLYCDIKSELLITEIFWHFTPFGTNKVVLISTNGSRFSGGVLGNPDLIISNVAHADIGYFRCSARNSAGDGYGPNIMLAVQTSADDLPIVEIVQQQYTVVLGNNVTMHCTVKSQLLVTNVVWQKKSGDTFKDITTDGVSFSGSSPTDPDLVVISVRFDNSGDYRCTVTNYAGTRTSSTTELIVTGDKPIITITSKFYTVPFGHNVTLTCSVTAEPALTSVYWIHNVSDGTIEVTKDNVKHFYSVSSPSLTIIEAKAVDIGWYIAVAVNLAGETFSEPIYFNVSANKPIVTLPVSFYEVLVGENITLQCDVFAYPELIKINWTRYIDKSSGLMVIPSDLKFIYGDLKNPSLTIRNVKLNDSGNYVCEGTNAAGTTFGTPITLRVVGGLPRVTLPSSAYSVTYGQNITLECIITALPNITSVTWMRKTKDENIPINRLQSKYYGGTVSNPSLTMLGVTFEDGGDYICSGTNIVGSAVGQISLLVNGGIPLVHVSSNMYVVNIGDNVTMNCNVSGNPDPTSVIWKTNTSGLSGTVYSGGTIDLPNLTIYNVNLAYTGWYTCTATNIVGVGSGSSIYLNVTGEEVCKDEIFPRIYNAATLCTETSTLSCTVTCDSGHVTRNGQKSVYFKCTNNEWTPSLPPKGCIEYTKPYTDYKIEATYRLSFNASYCLSGVENYLQSLKSTFEQQATSTCNNDVFSAGTLEIRNIKLSVSNRLVYTEYTLSVKDQAVSSSNRAFCKVAIEYKVVDIFTVQGSIDCVYATSAIDTTAVQFLSTVDTCPNSTTTVSTSAETFCVYDVPSVVGSRLSYTADNGNHVTLECNVESNAPILSVYWVLNTTGQLLTFFSNDTSGRYQGSTPNNPSLTIVNVDFIDIGYYYCHAVNKFGEGSSSAIHLNVIQRIRGLPVITSTNRNLQYIEGQTAEIDCSINEKSEPSTVYWQFSSSSSSAIYQPFTFNERFSGSTGQMPSLKINNLREDDTGYYTCYAVNVLGVGTGNPVRVEVKKLGQGTGGGSVGESSSTTEKLSCTRTFILLLGFAVVGIAIANVTCILLYILLPLKTYSLIQNIRQWRVLEKVSVIVADVLLSLLTVCAVAGIISVVTCTDNKTGATLGITSIAIIPGILLSICYLALCGYILSKRFTRVNNKTDGGGLISSESPEPEEHANLKSWRHFQADLPGVEHLELKRDQVEVPNKDDQEGYASTFRKPPDIYASTFKNEPLISTPGRHAQSLPPIEYQYSKEERRKKRRKKKKKKAAETFDTMHESDGAY